MASFNIKFNEKNLTEEQKTTYHKLNEEAKELHPNIDDYIINLVNLNYVLNDCKDEDITDEERECRRNLYDTGNGIYETEKILSVEEINNEISPVEKNI